MRKLLLNALLPACVMGLSGCATSLPPAPPALSCPTLAPAPASVMMPQPADFKQRMSIFLFQPLPAQTK